MTDGNPNSNFNSSTNSNSNNNPTNPTQLSDMPQGGSPMTNSTTSSKTLKFSQAANVVLEDNSAEHALIKSVEDAPFSALAIIDYLVEKDHEFELEFGFDINSDDPGIGTIAFQFNAVDPRDASRCSVTIRDAKGNSLTQYKGDEYWAKNAALSAAYSLSSAEYVGPGILLYKNPDELMASRHVSGIGYYSNQYDGGLPLPKIVAKKGMAQSWSNIWAEINREGGEFRPGFLAIEHDGRMASTKADDIQRSNNVYNKMERTQEIVYGGCNFSMFGEVGMKRVLFWWSMFNLRANNEELAQAVSAAHYFKKVSKERANDMVKNEFARTKNFENVRPTAAASKLAVSPGLFVVYHVNYKTMINSFDVSSRAGQNVLNALANGIKNGQYFAVCQETGEFVGVVPEWYTTNK